MKYVVNDDVVLSQPLEGPLSAHLGAFAQWARDLGYARGSRYRQVHLAACFMDDNELLQRLVGTFGAFDDLRAAQDLVGPGNIEPLLVEPWDVEFGFARWKPMREETPRAALEQLYQSVPGPFPGLYEALVLSYR